MRAILYDGPQEIRTIADWGRYEEMYVQLQVRVHNLAVGMYVFVAPLDSPITPIPVCTWGILDSANIFALWRSCLLLERISVISGRNITRTFTAASRISIGPYTDRFLEDTQKMVGPGVHDEIMSMPVPQQIIDWILQLPPEDEPSIAEMLVEELDAGTVNWQPTFKKFGLVEVA